MGIAKRAAIAVPVSFDASNPEHRLAYIMMMYEGRQHPTLRFHINPPHESVLHTMQAELAKLACTSELALREIDTTYNPYSPDATAYARMYHPASYHTKVVRGQGNNTNKAVLPSVDLSVMPKLYARTDADNRVISIATPQST